MAAVAGLGLALGANAPAAELVGRAILPADTLIGDAPTGRYLEPANGRRPPFAGTPVQGVSALLPGPRSGVYLALSDNGFGAGSNSADYALRIFAVEIDFDNGAVHPADARSGERLPLFDARALVYLRDPARRAGFALTADRERLPVLDAPVPEAVRRERLLTGSDFDPESFVRMGDGSFWVGEEFGPSLLHLSADGVLLRAPVPLPGVRSPHNPWGDPPNLPGSKGLEGLARAGSYLYAMQEGPLDGAADRHRLLIHEFDPAAARFTGRAFGYRMERPVESGQAIGELTAIDSRRFLVIERDSEQGERAQFKRVYAIDLDRLDASGDVHKTLVADLLALDDPGGLGGSATRDGVFRFPFVTIESVLILDPRTLLVANDNNYPFSSGRDPGQPDATEFILLGLPRKLAAQ